MECPELRVYRDRGRRLPLRLYRGRPGGALLLLSPGFGGACSDYAFLARAWQARGYHVAVLEHPGSARWQALQLAPYRLFCTPMQLRHRAHRPEEVQARPLDALYLLGRLQAELSPPSVGMAGHSLGSATALSVAMRGEVAAVAALSPHPPGWLFEPADYARLRSPCLMLLGDRDRPFEARLEAARLSGAELCVIPGAGHMAWAGWGSKEQLGQAARRTLEFWDRHLKVLVAAR